jgi:hypothetical protein
VPKPSTNVPSSADSAGFSGNSLGEIKRVCGPKGHGCCRSAHEAGDFAGPGQSARGHFRDCLRTSTPGRGQIIPRASSVGISAAEALTGESEGTEAARGTYLCYSTSNVP